MADLPTTPPRKLTEAESESFTHTSYVLVARSHHCTSCDAIQNYSDLFEVHTHPTKTALSKAKILKPAHTLTLEMPIAHVTTPITNVPVCHECLNWTTGLHPFKNAVQAPCSYDAWTLTLQRKALELANARRAARAKHEPELDML